MTLIVEDGTGLSTAESFCSVATATTYHSKFGNAEWLDYSESEQEIHLRRATRYLEAKFRTRWQGTRVLLEQALSWPRYGVEDSDGIYVDSDEVPTLVANATAELALISAGGETLNPTLDAGTIKRERSKVGEIEEEIEYVGGKREVKSFSFIDDMLQPLLAPLGRLYRS